MDESACGGKEVVSTVEGEENRYPVHNWKDNCRLARVVQAYAAPLTIRAHYQGVQDFSKGVCGAFLYLIQKMQKANVYETFDTHVCRHSGSRLSLEPQPTRLAIVADTTGLLVFFYVLKISMR